MSTIHRWVLASTVFAGVAITAPASAGERECSAAHDQAAVERKGGAHARARKHLLVCSADDCTAVRSECGVWLSEVDAQIVTVVVRGAGGGKLIIDGAPAEANVDGSIPLDPGTHTLTLEKDGASTSRALTLAPGDRKVVFDFNDAGGGATVAADASVGPEPAPEGGGKSKLLPIVIGGAGVALAAVGAVFWLGSSGKVSDLDDQQCAPNCAADDVDSVRSQRLLGDIFFIAGLAAIGVATYLFLAPSKPAAAATASAPRPRLRFTGNGFTF